MVPEGGKVPCVGHILAGIVAHNKEQAVAAARLAKVSGLVIWG